MEKEEKMGEWRTRHLRGRERGKGDVGVEKEKEERKGGKMESVFCSIYEFLTDPEEFNKMNFLCNSLDVNSVGAANSSVSLVFILWILLLFLLLLRRPEASNTRAPS